MIILSSPAKTMDFGHYPSDTNFTKPQFLDKSAQLVAALKSQSVDNLAAILKVSHQIAKANHQHYQTWKKNPAKKNSKPAILAYQGTVFQQLSASMYTKDQKEYAQKSLRIISALYGLLRPFDLIQPYRLELDSKVNVDGKNLYQFWKEELTKTLRKEVSQHTVPIVLDLSSQAYGRVIDRKAVDCPWYTVEFKQLKGKAKQNVGIYAKQARGMMLDSLIRNKANSFDKITSFQSAGYQLDRLTKDKVVFVRDAN